MEKGLHILLIDVEKGGFSINDEFFVDFEIEPHGPALAHEMQ